MDFLSTNFMPHGQCYFWQPTLLLSHVMADLVISASYFSIPIAIWIFIKKRPDIEFRRVLSLFAAFILLCGITHLYNVYVVWVGSYGVQAILKSMTALVSFTTAIYIFKLLPNAIALPTRDEWEAMKVSAIEKRYKDESESFFSVIADSLHDGIVVCDRKLKVVMANAAANRIFLNGQGSLVGHEVAELIPDSVHHHDAFAEQFFSMPHEYQHPMAHGRTIKAKSFGGDEIDIRVKLSQFEYFDESMVAVSVEQNEQNESSEQNEKYQRTMRALASVSDGAWEWNIKTDEVWWNAKHAELIGVDVNAKPSVELWLNHIHMEDRKRVLEYINDSIKRSGDYQIEYLGLTPEGNYNWFRSRGKVYQFNNESVFMSGMLSNIQHTHQLQAELDNKTEFLNRVIDSTVANLFVFNVNANRITYVNKTLSKTLGYIVEMLAHIKNPFELIHPQDRQPLKIHVQNVLRKPEVSHEIVVRVRHKNGQWVWCYCENKVNDVDTTGRPNSFLGAFIDISDLKEKEQAIQAWAADFYSIFNQAAVGIALVSLEGTFKRVNEKLCEMWGYPEAVLLKKSFLEITYPDDLETDLKHVNALLAGEYDSYTLEKRYISADGAIFWALLTVKLVRDSEGKASHFISVIEDIDSMKETERALSESNKALEIFAFTASHDLQEPLRKIKTFSGLLQERLKGKLDEPEAQFELGRLSGAANRMSKLITSILELSRASQVQLDIQETSLSELFLLVENQLDLSSEDLDYSYTVEGDIGFYADAIQMARVFQNLMVNAIKYKYESRPVNIKVHGRLENNRAIILFSDDGPGVPEDALIHIFSPFKRLVGKEKEGSGMGLAICRQIVQKHQGSIHALSGQGPGLTIEISLPAKPRGLNG
ncbi:PAS domain S-box protein [Reinekea marina]|uniref:histidine kinase n=1 Tax=Reinekea marina TaxID=1310421 RepID=A0ABV7WTE9_9GAMM|nr:PAS domain S-box protein [Reinekea marina]MDN3648180.1 PAS domain S-box protein [Reinekea marina]